MKDKKVFAEGLSFQKLAIIFILFSVFGCYYEMILNLVKSLIKDGTIFWEIRTAVIYGPFSVIYGAGAVLMIFLLARKEYKWYEVVIYGSLVGGFFEYFVSFFQELFTGTTSWDYSKQLLNINGRTTIPIMLAWGIMCLALVKVIYPYLSYFIERIPYRPGTILLNILIVFLCVDMFISFSAVIRQYLRKNNVHPYTVYGEFLDDHYPDERLKKVYPNMKFVKD